MEQMPERMAEDNFILPGDNLQCVDILISLELKLYLRSLLAYSRE